MFIDEQTQNTIHADLDNSVSYGSLTSLSVTGALLKALRDTPEYIQICVRIPSYVWANPDDSWWQDDGQYVLQELFEVMNSYAPEGYYFGTHIGDGADFGYWKIETE